MPTINRKRASLLYPVKYQRENDSSRYYNSRQWYNLRNQYIRQNPLCEDCLSFDIVRAAEHVHHIIPFMRGRTDTERWRLLTDETNLRSLCQECHHKVHKKMKSIM